MAIAAGVVFGLSLVLLAAFFRTQSTRLDALATWGLVVFALLIIPVMLVVRDRLGQDGAAATALTVAGILGVAVVGLGEAATGLRLVDFRRVAIATTIGFVLFLLWVGGVSAMLVAASNPVLPVTLGWLGLGAIALGIAIMAWIFRTPGVATGDASPNPTAMTAFFVPLAGVVAWLGWLGALL
jgi:hypothetical protein